MKRMGQRAFAVLAILALGPVVMALPAPTLAAGLVQLAETEIIYQEPRAGEMIIDGLVVRPVTFVATVVGGMGSLSGAVLGGFVVGVASVVFQTVLPIEMRPNRDVWVYAMVLLILLLRPSGLVKVKSIEEKV